MKTGLIKSALLLVAFLLQYGIVQSLTVFSFSANLCVLALVGVCYFSSPVEAAVFGGCYGLLIDGAVGRGFGTHVLLGLYLGLAVKLFANEKINNSPAIMAAYVWLFTLARGIAYGLLSAAVLRGEIAASRWLLTALAEAMINAVVALPVFWATLKLKRRRAVG